MPGLANVFFRNIFATLDGGVLPGTLASGTTSGSPIQLGGVGGLGKMLFLLNLTQGSVAASASMYLATATASGGTFTSISQTLVSTTLVASSTSATLNMLDIDTRNEAFANLATGSAAPTWVKPVIAIAGATLGVGLTVLGWEAGNDPASNYDGSTVTIKETDFY